MSGGGFSFEATDNSSNVFNPGDLISRSLGGSINFGIDPKQVTLAIGIIAATAVLLIVLTRKR